MELEYYTVVESHDDDTVTVQFDQDDKTYQAQGVIEHMDGLAVIDRDSVEEVE